ncbi:MAG: type II secretion system F family protein [Candidatus Cloacimonetes bacterium]|nr:type II secretion system F family protein [Candidatus Cloacimonadota bacterium]
MLKEYRYSGISLSGKTIQGIVLVHNSSTAKKLVNQLAVKHKLKINSILPKKNFIYNVKLPNGKKIKGKQSAYTKQEVANALARIGYHNAKILPVLLDFKPKPSSADIMMFVNLSSFLLKEKMTYDKILHMLSDEQTNSALKETLRNIEAELKAGKEGSEVFSRYQDIFGKFPAYMLGLATKSGNMAEVYDATAKFMERDQEYKKSMRQALLAPAFTVFATIVACMWYIVSIFPATARLFTKFGVKVPPMTDFTLKLSDFLGANFWWMILIFIVPIIIILRWWKTSKGRVWRDKFIIKLPVIGHLLHKSSIEIFFRVFSAIYSGAADNIETLQSSAEACRNAHMEKGVKEIAIPLMLKEGMSLVPALERADVFNRTSLSRLKTGAETGNVRQSAQQIALFYEKETSYKINNIIQYIQTLVGIFIALAITLLTVVSAEIAFIQPPTPGMTGM